MAGAIEIKYVHAVAGRLRIRSRLFRCPQRKIRVLQSKLDDFNGVLSSTVNQRAGCLTVQFDDTEVCSEEILQLVEAECQLCAKRTKPAALIPSKVKSKGVANGLVSMAGKVALNALVQRGVNYSLSSVIGVLR